MPFSINPDLIENNDVEIQTVDGELALFHKPSGNTLIVDEDTTVSEKLQSPLRDNVDLDGNDLISGGSGEFADLEAESVNTDGLVTMPAKSFDGSDFSDEGSGHFLLDIDISDLDFDAYVLKLGIRNEGELRLTFDDDDSFDSGDYNWELNDGSRSEGDDYAIIADMGDSGTIRVGQTIFIEPDWMGGLPRVAPIGFSWAGASNRLENWSTGLGASNNPSTSINISIQNGFDPNSNPERHNIELIGGNYV